ncbi:hypothetical protein [Natrinema caseinilyticum]|uniref:hypothetical protein n=1 Tax=Natrinema caseinilyticum TaxID=2961570 RepID=UPI0020C22484|nr:hypothetical protein [Natrinema caseinilyticum]
MIDPVETRRDGLEWRVLARVGRQPVLEDGYRCTLGASSGRPSGVTGHRRSVDEEAVDTLIYTYTG